MRFRKLYPRDLQSPTIQRSLNQYTRVGRIIQVNSTKGTCVIQWLDRPGYREDVLLLQGSHKEWNIPEKGAVVLVAFDVKDQARIIRYFNVGHSRRVSEKTLPVLKEGEKLWECAGSFLYMKENGDIVLWSQQEGIVTLENSSNTFKSETVNWRVQTDVGSQFFGLIKRLVNSPYGDKESKVVTTLAGDSLGEYKFLLYETAEDQSNLLGATTPLIELVFGTVVDDDGNLIDKDGNTTLDPAKAVCVQLIVTKSGSQLLKLSLDKEGNLSITAPEIVVNNGTQGAARKEDRTIVNSSTDSSFVDWMDAVDTFIRAASSAGALPIANSNYISAVTSVPSSVEGKIDEGSNSVKIGD